MVYKSVYKASQFPSPLGEALWLSFWDPSPVGLPQLQQVMAAIGSHLQPFLEPISWVSQLCA